MGHLINCDDIYFELMIDDFGIDVVHCLWTLSYDEQWLIQTIFDIKIFLPLCPK